MRRRRIWKRDVPLQGFIDWLSRATNAIEVSMDGLLMKYFVLRPGGTDDHAKASREALRKYAEEIDASNPVLAKELRAWGIKLAMTATNGDRK